MDFNDSGAPIWKGEVDLGGNDLAYNPEEPLVIGGNNLSDWQFCGEIDEVRLSNVIVNTEPNVLKRRGIQDGTVIGHFHLEDDCRSSVWPDYWPETELSGATGGTVPTLVAIGKRKCLCDVNGVRVDNLVDTNCLNISGGKVQWTDPQLLKDSVDSLTIEFFVNGKAEENADWAGIVRADYTSTKQYLPFNLSHHKMSGSYNLVCRVDTDRNYNENTKNASIPLDGKWHHVAIQLERQTDTDGNKVTSLILCVDYNYENRCEMSVSGWIQYPSGTHFGFGLAGTPFKGKIDEVRLTKGILPPDKFLRLKGADGLILVVR